MDPILAGMGFKEPNKVGRNVYLVRKLMLNLRLILTIYEFTCT